MRNIVTESHTKTQAETLRIVLDPVMGDEGHLYVDENVVPVYKSLLPHADLIVPNQFEAEYAPWPLLSYPSLPIEH